ncbi:MAG: 4-aminobutyrate--2-oxoglutarate transaminase [Gammaproteobacteria bacterium]|nr:4-aminobutyrate--2-oxoglutarate transaminase [Gammaproteobacteria bacterium]
MAAIPRGVGNLLQVYAEHASNAEIWDVEGRRYIDFASGIAVLNTGHLHPRVQAAVAAQLAKLSHTCFQVTPYENYVALAERLNEIVPGSGPKKTIFLTTGAEAIENAVKIARHHTKRSAVIAFGGSFHGRTLACMSLTGKVQPYKAGFGSMLPDVFHAPFPIEYHGVSVAQSLAAIENLFKADVDPQRVAALIVEPVQGEGGFYVAPPEFLQALRALCDRHGIVFIVDEVQTGFARTGRMFAIEHSGVEPDLVTLAKSLAGGLPLSAVVGKAEIMDSPAPGGLGGTYAGSPLGCAAGLAVLEVIESEQLCARAERLGAAVRARLTDLQSRWPCIGEVDAELTKALVQAAGRRGLVLLSCGVHANVIRFLMPLTTPDAILAEGLAILEAALEDVAR